MQQQDIRTLAEEIADDIPQNADSIEDSLREQIEYRNNIQHI